MNHVLKGCVLIYVLIISACTPVHDLDAPCKDFGRFCHQEPINFVGISCDATRR